LSGLNCYIGGNKYSQSLLEKVSSHITGYKEETSPKSYHLVSQLNNRPNISDPILCISRTRWKWTRNSYKKQCGSSL